MLIKGYIVGAVIVGFILTYYIYFRSTFFLWLYKRANKAKISLIDIAIMRLQKLRQEDIKRIINAIAKTKIGIREIVSYHIQGGDIDKITEAIVTAGKANMPLSFDRASQIELAGRNVLEAANMSVEPPVVETFEVSGMTKDGVQLRARYRVAMLSNLNNFAGGFGKETVMARVGAAIVRVIGSAADHNSILANPSILSERITGMDCDEKIPDIHQNAAFKILSIDIEDANVAANLGASLRAGQAEADEKAARIRAEAGRIETDAVEKEMEGRILEKTVQKLTAEAQVPRAIATALRNGRLSVEDYFRMKNQNAAVEVPKIFESMIRQSEKQDIDKQVT
ncbi:MAG: UPF0365 family protein [Desulfobacterales bacterium]|nr:UPF0365 family protein [Desulfobacterales bacterium]